MLVIPFPTFRHVHRWNVSSRASQVQNAPRPPLGHSVLYMEPNVVWVNRFSPARRIAVLSNLRPQASFQIPTRRRSDESVSSRHTHKSQPSDVRRSVCVSHGERFHKDCRGTGTSCRDLSQAWRQHNSRFGSKGKGSKFVLLTVAVSVSRIEVRRQILSRDFQRWRSSEVSFKGNFIGNSFSTVAEGLMISVSWNRMGKYAKFMPRSERRREWTRHPQSPFDTESKGMVLLVERHDRNQFLM